MRAFPKSAAVLTACLFLATACTRTDDSPDKPETGNSPTVQSPSSTPETTDPPASSTPSSSTPATLTDRLVPTDHVPGLNATSHWQDGKTGPASPDLFGLCAKVDLLSIGATDVVERTYFPPDDSDDNAAEQMAEFPDGNTAARAWAVLKSWHDACSQKRSANPGLTVRPLVAVPVSIGSARWYLLSWTPGGEETGRFEAFGMVRNGTRIAVLRMDSSGQDYDYPVGHEPMVGMVNAAATLLG
jgi:hypothetical protein